MLDIDYALTVFSALSQETRLRLFKMLIEYGNTGVAAGVLSERLGVSHNNLSFHLAQLSHAELVTSCKKGRQVIYCVKIEAIEALIGFLHENCCVKESEQVCTPVQVDLPNRDMKKC